MTPERWAQVKLVVGQALDTPLAERAAFVQRACSGDESLRQEVESLLAADADANSLPSAREAIASAAESFVADQESSQREFLNSVLGKKYEILRRLGSGGMGDVFLARERALERFVAIKLLRPELATAAESRERFRREASTVAQLTHQGILRLHTFDEVGGVWFVMGYVRGKSLAERLRLEGQIPWKAAHRLLTDLAEALEYAHEHRVIHRDIKPANILLDDDSGRAVLADFGIAKAVGVGDSLTKTGAVIGTPDYMSPEATTGSDVDERSDIYSLGAVAYRMLTGHLPHTGADLTEVMERRRSQEARPVQTLAPAVPDALASIVEKCLARKREDRWPTARSLREALGRIAGGNAEDLPDGLRELPTFGPYALLWAAAWITVAIGTPRPASERALLFLIAFLVPVGLVLHVWNGGRHGLRPTEVARIASWPPTFWGMWWPRSLRRPSDLWEHLPWQARLTRSVLSAFFVAVPVLIGLRQWLRATGAADGSGDGWFILSEGLLLGGAVAVAGGALMWARGQGLSLGESFRVLFGATVPSSSWQTPRITRLLAPLTGRVRAPHPDDAADHERAIEDAIPLLPVTVADTGVAAVVVGRRLLLAIERCDVELHSLEEIAPASELDRLGAQLASFGDPSVTESRDRRDMRELTRQQLQLVRRGRGRREMIVQQRARLFDLLRGLWTQVRATADAPPDDPRRVAEASERVTTLCAEIAAKLEAGPTIQGPQTGREERSYGD